MHGVRIPESTDPLNEYISVNEDEEIHVSGSSIVSSGGGGGSSVNWRSSSIEKRRGKSKVVYKSDVVMQMWQKTYREVRGGGSGNVVASLGSLETCQNLLEILDLLVSTYTISLQLFVDKPQYQNLFVRMKSESRLEFLQQILGQAPCYPQPPPPPDC